MALCQDTSDSLSFDNRLLIVYYRPSQGSNPSTKQTHLAEVYSRVPSAKSPVLGGFHSKNGPQAQCTTCSYRLYLKDATKGPVDL